MGSAIKGTLKGSLARVFIRIAGAQPEVVVFEPNSRIDH
jgi:hypothetical protein